MLWGLAAKVRAALITWKARKLNPLLFLFFYMQHIVGSSLQLSFDATLKLLFVLCARQMSSREKITKVYDEKI